MGSHFKQISFNLILISTLIAPMAAFAESSPGSDYFQALVEQKPKTQAEMDQIRKDVYDKALINEANTLSKINADHTKKVEAQVKAAAIAKEKAKKANKTDKKQSSQTSDSKQANKKTAPPVIKKDEESKADIKVESNMPDEVDFNSPSEPTKEKGADASAPTPIPSKSK